MRLPPLIYTTRGGLRQEPVGRRKPANFIYLSAMLDAAIWGAELAIGEGRGRIYIVEPVGSMSYRSRDPFRIIIADEE